MQLFVGIAGASEFYGLDMPSGAGGFGVAAAPIPNNPGLAGRTFYAQALSAWGGCQPTTFGLSASSAVAITVQP